MRHTICSFTQGTKTVPHTHIYSTRYLTDFGTSTAHKTLGPARLTVTISTWIPLCLARGALILLDSAGTLTSWAEARITKALGVDFEAGCKEAKGETFHR